MIDRIKAWWGWVLLLFGIVPQEFEQCGVVTGYAGERYDMEGMIAPVLIEDICIREDWNARKRKPGEDVRALRESMGVLGQLNVISVKRRDDGKFDLIAGEMRLLAAIEADKRQIEARIFEADISPEQELRIMIDENLVRRSLNVIEEANAFSRLLEYKTVDQVATLYHRSTTYVRERLDLLTLPKEVQRMMIRDNNPLRIHQALLLVSLNNHSKQLQLARTIAPSTASSNLSEGEARGLVREVQGIQDLPLEEPTPRKRREPVQSITVGPTPSPEPTKTQTLSATPVNDEQAETSNTVVDETEEATPADEVTPPIQDGVTLVQLHGGLLCENGAFYITDAKIKFSNNDGYTDCVFQPKLFLDLSADNADFIREGLAEESVT